MKKNNAKLYKNKFKLKFIKKRQNALARRELRNKHGLFITHQNKPAINSNNEAASPNKLIKLKKKIKFKFSIVNKNQDSKNEALIENNNNLNNQLLSYENSTNINMVDDENMKNISNSNTPIKKQKSSNSKNSKYSSGRWEVDEHKKFIEAIIKYGNDWKEVQKYIGTRSSSQARSHAQKFFIKLKQEQGKSKISNEIDYSNSSIKNFHDALQSLSPEKKQKIIKELENIVFDKQISNKKRKRHRSNKNNIITETNTEMDFLSGTEYFEEENNRRKISVDSLNEKKLIDSRISVNKCDMFTDEEYEKSFQKVFSDREGKEIETESRKLSIEDDFMFNLNV
jgi:SHAQKYF class myb-like DNA-binding protein